MNPRFLLIVAGIALSFMAAIVVVYLDMFGINRIHDQAIWGAFGDYFGGILNPIFALFAFLGVLWSLDLQMKQVRQLALDKKADEILQVVKDIDARLAGLLQTNIGETSGFDIHILHMVAEAGRGPNKKGIRIVTSSSYRSPPLRGLWWRQQSEKFNIRFQQCANSFSATLSNRVAGTPQSSNTTPAKPLA